MPALDLQSGGSASSLRTYDLNAGQPHALRTISLPHAPTCVTASSMAICAGCDDGSLSFFDARARYARVDRTLESVHTGGVSCVAARDHLVVTCGKTLKSINPCVDG